VRDVRVQLLGEFRVVTGDRELPARDWPSRRAQELVALLALAERRRLPRDRVIEQLWPHLGAEAGAANLRKAAHHARRALGEPDAVALRAGRVELFPGRAVHVDAEAFLRDAQDALRGADARTCANVAARFPGELLPDSPYESWAQEPRRLVHARRVELLRRAGDWERLLELEPTDEAACRELMRAAIGAGQRHVAIRLFERLRVALLREMGARPDAATQALYETCTAGLRPRETVFVGRETELAAAAAQRAAVAGGGAAAVLVRGPAGIGKSALCREVARRAREDGWSVTTVTATSPPIPYAPIAAAVEGQLTRVEGLPERTRAVLAALGTRAPAQGAPTRHQVVAALRRALGAAPTVLVVEDAHLLDEATADVLHQLVAGDGGAPLLVVLACRAEWLRTRLPHGVAELARSERALTLELGPLGDGEIAELVAHGAVIPPPPDVVAAIVRAAEGSPFFALELARAPASRAGALPQTVRQAIARRLAGLDGATLDALTALAAGEEELDLAGVLALTGLQERGASAVLDVALDAGILVVSGARYRFRHGLVQRALRDELPSHRRVQIHRDAARRMARTGGAPERIAHHWLRGERPAEAVPWLLQAARGAVRVGAFADALGRVERLLQEAPEHREGLCLRAEILDALGDGRAPGAYAAAAALGGPAAPDLRARQALAQLKASDPDGALRTLDGVVPTSPAGRLAEALTLSAAAAIGRYADADTAAAKAEEAHRLALELGDPGAILDATWAHALAAHARGELPARLREYLRATRHLPAIATRVFDGQLCVTERMLYGGLPYGEIIAFAESLAEEAQRLGAARGEAFAWTLRGEAALLAGRLDEADRDFADGARLHGRIGAAAGEALSLLGRAQVAIYRDRPALARPFLADALLLARESEVGHHTLDRIYGAMVEAAAGGPDGVRLVRAAEHAIRGPAETCPTCRIAFIVPATIAAARAGDLPLAHRYADDCARALDIVALPPAWHASVEEARGWLERAEGRPARAREHFRAAAAGFGTWEQPLDARRCAALAAA
jgi:DNA-binding SARP family transcriptional activator